ncbi:MAG TPA: hypothetical protein PLX99_05815, partial [Gammaproteobacteria bacterium]|nr:hypothetical protein [Gammaproteobacteria bacterium]
STAADRLSRDGGPPDSASLSADTTLSLFGGAEVAGVLRLEEATGRLVSESDQSTAPCLGASLRVRF